MAESAHPATSTLKVGQLALVTGLSVILVMVLIYQFGSQQKLVLKPRRPASLQTITGAESDALRHGTAVGQETAKGWPLLSLDTVLKHDPFALPPFFLPTVTISERNPAREQEQIVKAVEQKTWGFHGTESEAVAESATAGRRDGVDQQQDSRRDGRITHRPSGRRTQWIRHYGDPQ